MEGVNVLRVSKIREVKTPERAHAGDGGIDFFLPFFDEDFLRVLEDKNPDIDWYKNENTKIIIGPNKFFTFPSGIRLDVPFGYALITANKSGLHAKEHLVVSPCVIDHEYQGEVVFTIYNMNDNYIALLQHQKIIQCVLHTISTESIIEVPDNTLFSEISQRGTGGFGSTGL